MTSSRTSRRSRSGWARSRSSSATRPGFIANALLFGYLNHAVSMFESRYATREDIDAAMRFGCGYPMGPLALLDLIGLDTAYEILDTMYKQGRDRLHAPSPGHQADGQRGACSDARAAGGSTPTSSRARRRSWPTRTRPRVDRRRARTLRPVASVGVVGSGTMATGIIEVFAKAGYDVTFVARGEDKVAGVQAALARSRLAGDREGPDDRRGRRRRCSGG